MLYAVIKINYQVTLIVVKVTDWPKEDYGKFHEADSYIVLNSHKIQELSQVLKIMS